MPSKTTNPAIPQPLVQQRPASKAQQAGKRRGGRLTLAWRRRDGADSAQDIWALADRVEPSIPNLQAELCQIGTSDADATETPSSAKRPVLPAKVPPWTT